MKQCLLALATACGLVAAVPTAVRADGFYVYPGGVQLRVYRGDDDRDYWPGAVTNGVSAAGANMKCASVGANAMSIPTDGGTKN